MPTVSPGQGLGERQSHSAADGPGGGAPKNPEHGVVHLGWNTRTIIVDRQCEPLRDRLAVVELHSDDDGSRGVALAMGPGVVDEALQHELKGFLLQSYGGLRHVDVHGGIVVWHAARQHTTREGSQLDQGRGVGAPGGAAVFDERRRHPTELVCLFPHHFEGLAGFVECAVGEVLFDHCECNSHAAQRTVQVMRQAFREPVELCIDGLMGRLRRNDVAPLAAERAPCAGQQHHAEPSERPRVARKHLQRRHPQTHACRFLISTARESLVR